MIGFTRYTVEDIIIVTYSALNYCLNCLEGVMDVVRVL